MTDLIRRALLSGLLLAFIALLAAVATGAEASDSSAVPVVDSIARDLSRRPRLEFGIRADVSNEYYFEDTFDDSTFRDASPSSAPEVVQVGVASVEWAQADVHRRRDARLLLEGGAGSRLQWGTLDSRWSRVSGGGWGLGVSPRLQWRHDRTFDRNREELRAHIQIQARHRPEGVEHAMGMRVWGDLLRSSGAGSEYMLDRDVAGCSGTLERLFGLRGDLRLEYSVEGRAFPDSAVRTHLEQRLASGLRHEWDSGAMASLQLGAIRRTARASTFDSRDRFWTLTGQGELRSPALGAVAPMLLWELEDQRYDLPDSLLYFDYSRLRLSAMTRFEPWSGWALELGPGGEWLLSGEMPDERYVEGWGSLDVQWLTLAGLISLSPSAGWREYEEGPSDDYPALHSSFAYLDVTLLFDHALPGRLRARGFGYGRLERHADRSQDSRSLYFSLDVRRLF